MIAVSGRPRMSSGDRLEHVVLPKPAQRSRDRDARLRSRRSAPAGGTGIVTLRSSCHTLHLLRRPNSSGDAVGRSVACRESARPARVPRPSLAHELVERLARNRTAVAAAIRPAASAPRRASCIAAERREQQRRRLAANARERQEHPRQHGRRRARRTIRRITFRRESPAPGRLRRTIAGSRNGLLGRPGEDRQHDHRQRQAAGDHGKADAEREALVGRTRTV